MKLAPVPQNAIEWLAIKMGLVPVPLAYSHFGFLMSKAVLEAVDKQVFEAIGHHRVSLQSIADATELDAKALKALLSVIASMGMLVRSGDMYSLTRQSKKWILKESPDSLYWLMIFDNRVCIKWMDSLGDFLKTGRGLQYHDTFTDEEWFYYQKAMEAAASAIAKEATPKIPVSKGATSLLDIGGAHGLYAMGLCRKHPSLSAIVFDLPPAVSVNTKTTLPGKLAERITFQSGNILTDDIGIALYDNVLMVSVAHHFTNEENQLVANKVYRALKPGGYFTIIEALRPDDAELHTNMLSSLGNFFFSLSSTSGTWTLDEIKQWQHNAGLIHHRKTSFLTIPGYAAVTGRKA